MAKWKCLTGVSACVLSLAGSGMASAQSNLFGADTVSAYADFRLSLTSGEASWTQQGAGKTRFGNDTGTAAFDLAEAGLVWRPRFSWTLEGYVQLQYDENQDNEVGISEAFVRYRPVPRSAWRWSGRAGFFYPPISLEHEEEAWAVTASISPSVINSWVGEEVKGAGLEMRVERELGNHEIAATAGLFGFNDTTGVLISYRGWALHDIKTSFSSAYPVRVYPGHDRIARPFDETDDRPGFYLRLDWSPSAAWNFNVVGWDNQADPTSVNGSNRAWQTRFWNVGAEYEIDEHHRLLGQVMSGTTVVGAETPSGRHGLDFTYTAAYAMLVREIEATTWSVRADLFETEDRSVWTPMDFGETGWAGTAAWRYRLESGQTLSAEAVHVDSDRPLRALWGIEQAHAQTQLQLSWRLVR